MEYGILSKAKEPLDWKACNLNLIPLYYIVENKRVLHIPEKLTIIRKFSIIANSAFNSLLIIRLIKKFNKE